MQRKEHYSLNQNHTLVKFFAFLVAALVVIIGILFKYPLRQTSQHLIIGSDKEPDFQESKASFNTEATVADGLDWNTYFSSLGYSIKYPSTWFASPDPGIDKADILYDNEGFIHIVRSDYLADTSSTKELDWNNYFVIEIQQFSFQNLRLNPTRDIDLVINAIDGDSLEVLSEEELLTDTANGRLRIVEVFKELRISAYFIYEESIYYIYTSLEYPNDTERITLFKEIASSIHFRW